MNLPNEAQKQNPALAGFEIFIGEWRTEGIHPYVPGKKFHGRTVFEWIEGGAFLRICSEIYEPEIPSGIMFIGSDNMMGTYFMLYFDERGISRKYDVLLDGQVMTWDRISPEFSQRMLLTISNDGQSVTSKGEMNRGEKWESDLNLTYFRA